MPAGLSVVVTLIDDSSAYLDGEQSQETISR
jgi:hypothetical protein